ncbi:hypothetical protein F511_33398 [Dorcoceras hygrometricum]|uniref:Uncharacterized protein n=1 Tax=Dorcoceras hygrometricum TaxID=472368 RepID=A0A2Z7B699_9LAMI|nr:hypothetical protein F511_33398 [Dorcoceras hygrometricum]
MMAGNDGNSPEKLTMNSTQGFERRTKVGRKIAKNRSHKPSNACATLLKTAVNLNTKALKAGNSANVKTTSLSTMIILISGTLSFVTLSAMASSLVSNTNQVHFASVLAMDNSEMVAMFEALVASGLNGFLGCMSDISETALIEFYEKASVRDDKVLPVEGLIDIHEVPKDLIFDARTEFSLTGEQLSTSYKKRELKIEYRLLSDIVAKSITVKAGSFDAVTHERFLLMTAIFVGVSVNWGRLLFKIFKDMVTPETRQDRGYAVHIFGRYIAINDKIAVDSVEGLAGKSRVKKTPVKRSVSKKRPAAVIEERVVKKKRTVKGKAAPSKAKLKLVPVALDAEPLQTVDPTSADDVDTIIEQELIASNANRSVDTASDTDGEPETVVEKQPVQRSAEKEKDADFGASEDLVLGNKNEISDDMMLPSVTAAEVTKIKFGLPLEIHEVQDKDWYYASLPKISAHDKGKKPLEADDVVKGNPAREMVQLIYGDVEFLVQLREQEKEHGLIEERTFSSKSLDDSDDNSGVVLAQFYSLAISTCWVRGMVLVDGIWTPLQGNEFWKSSCRLSLFVNRRQLPQSVTEDCLAPHCCLIEPDQYWGAAPSIIKTWGWFRVCIDIVRYSMFGCLRPVGSVNPCRDIVVKSSVVDILEKVPTGFCDVLQQGTDINNFVEYFSDSVGKPILPRLPEVELISSNVSSVYRSPSPQSLSSSNNQLDFHLHTPIDEEVFATTTVGSIPAEYRRLDDSHSEVLDKIKQLETTIFDAFYQHNQVFHRLITGIRQEAHNDTNVLSLGLKAVRTQTAIISTEQADPRKEAKEQKAIIENMDERLDTIRGELLDFRAQAQENYNNLSSQLGELVACINRGSDKKREGSSNHRPQPPPDDQYRPNGGNANRGGGGGGSSGSGRRDDRKDSSTKKGSGSSGTGGPYKKNAEWWSMVRQIWFLGTVQISGTVYSEEKDHGLIAERTFSSKSLDDSDDNSGVVLAQVYSLAKSTCWVRPMVLVDGIWTPLQVGSVNPCRDIVVKSSVVDILEKVPTGFCDVLQQGTDINNFVEYFSDSVDSFNDLRTSMSRIISIQSKEYRRLDDSHSEVLDKIKQLETTIFDAFYQHNQVFHRLITGIRQEAHNDTNVLSLGLKAVRTQTAIISTEQADPRKEAKEKKAIIENMDERLATIRGEQLDFRAQAQENYNNLSSQLGELVACINRGSDKKREGSSNHRPQPPPDDQYRPSGGNANRGDGGGGSSGSGRRDDRKDSSTRKGSGSSGTGGPYKKNAEWWLYGKNQF